MSTTTAIAGNTVRTYGGITAAMGGNIALPVTSAPGPSTLCNSDELSMQVAGPETDATIAAGTDTKGTYKPLSSGTFGYQVPGNYIIRRVSTSISGVANTVLQSGASDFGRVSIHAKTTRRSVKITDWSYITGQPTATTETNDDFGADHAATPTMAIPGELTLMETGATPTSTDYSAKTD